MLAVLAASTVATVASLNPSWAGASPRTLAAPANLIALTGPGPNGSLWVLAGNGKSKTLTEINTVSGRTLFSEGVNPFAEDVSLSANGSVLALATAGGFASKAAVLLYSGTTGRFRSAALSPQTVTRVASNATGSTVYELRVGTGTISSFLLGTANGLGFDLPLTGQAVDLVPGPNSSTIVLQPDGTVSTVSFPSLAYTPTVSTGSPGRAMAITPDGSTLFVLHPPAKRGANASISVINATSHQVEKTISVPPECTDIAISPSGTTLYEGLRGTPYSLVKPITVP
jgi:hypothetical protein